MWHPVGLVGSLVERRWCKSTHLQLQDRDCINQWRASDRSDSGSSLAAILNVSWRARPLPIIIASTLEAAITGPSHRPACAPVKWHGAPVSASIIPSTHWPARLGRPCRGSARPARTDVASALTALLVSAPWRPSAWSIGSALPIIYRPTLFTLPPLCS